MSDRVGTPRPTATTRLFGVLGHPVSHSLSPRLHNAAFAALGVDACYLAFDVAPERFDAAIDGLAAVGCVGANVTVPHKRAALAACDALSDEADLIGAVNTLHWTEDGLVGDNTDAAGFVRSLDGVVSLRGRTAHVLGAGGAARAVVVGLARAGSRVVVSARRGPAARSLADLAVTAGAPDVAWQALDDPDVAASVGAADVVVNATPLGLHGERLPEPFHRLGAQQVAVDLVYGETTTPWLTDARASGATAVDGIGMLLHQAALAFHRWTGRDALAVMADVVGRPDIAARGAADTP